MNDLLSRIHPDALIPLVALLGGAAVFLVWIIAHYWAKARQAELHASLKLELLRQGKSAEEIERVLQAGSFPLAIPGARATAGAEQPSSAGPPAILDEASLVRVLGEEGYAAEDIETVLRLYQGGSAEPALREREARMIGELVRQGYAAEDIDRVVRAARTSAPAEMSRPR
jgi:SOS response regulatory protein OraA/RecX